MFGILILGGGYLLIKKLQSYPAKPGENIVPISSPSDTGDFPEIDSIVPPSGPIGTVIEIGGVNFNGFEGDLNAWIENEQGVKGIIRGEAGSSATVIKFVLKSSYCKKDTSYSGLACSGYLAVIPGKYKIYVEPWGNKSNETIFTVKEK
jgi:hypothetical protein